MIDKSKFISAAEQIAAEDPKYELGHDGHDGFCDCIGLVIGAIRRCGGQWRGTHGTNYAARSEMDGKVMKIVGSGDLQPGEVVYKAYEPEQGGYNLPAKYRQGGESCNGDLRDYYHVGIVESVYPLRIRHMTSPKAKMDTSLGKWGYHGRLKKIDYTGGGGKPMDEVIISGGNIEEPINMRKTASTGSPIVAKIPQGSMATLIEGGGAWNQIVWNGKTGYVMSQFVQKKGDDEEKVSVSKAELEKIYDMIGDWLGKRG